MAQRADAIDDEIYNHPDYAHRNGRGQVRLGCRYGGDVTVDQDDSGHRLTIDRCEVLRGEPMSGTGRYANDGTVQFTITFPRGSLRYEIDADGGRTWSGVIDGNSRNGSS